MAQTGGIIEFRHNWGMGDPTGGKRICQRREWMLAQEEYCRLRWERFLVLCLVQFSCTTGAGRRNALQIRFDPFAGA